MEICQVPDLFICFALWAHAVGVVQHPQQLHFKVGYEKERPTVNSKYSPGHCCKAFPNSLRQGKCISIRGHTLLCFQNLRINRNNNLKIKQRLFVHHKSICIINDNVMCLLSSGKLLFPHYPFIDFVRKLLKNRKICNIIKYICV